MKKIIAAFTALLAFGQAHANDKAQHFIGSAVVTIAVYAITGDLKHAAIAGIAVGVVKEIYDSRPGGTGFSGADLLADGLGVAAGAAIAYTFTIAF